MKLKLKFVFQKDFSVGIVQVVGIGKNIIETQAVEHFVVIMMIGIIHQKDEVALLGRNKRR
ncbi:hypothetical protein DXB32_07865 [Megamonas rupellensis]|nr:hypothetical protein DXB32_07865 [Megamonas rupellensis]